MVRRKLYIAHVVPNKAETFLPYDTRPFLLLSALDELAARICDSLLYSLLNVRCDEGHVPRQYIRIRVVAARLVLDS